MKVIVYEPDYDAKHRDVLGAFAQGIRRCGGDAEVRTLGDYQPCDVAVIFGLKKDSYAKTWPKQEVLDKHAGRSLIVVESAPVRRGEYWAIGYGGIGGGADFRNDGMTHERWESFDVPTTPWQRRPNGPIVVCGQLPRDTNVQKTDHCAWVRNAVAFYQAYGPVRFRPHPRIGRELDRYGVPAKLHDRGPLAETLAKARMVVTYNSTSGVDAALAGVPVVVCHPWAFAWPIAARASVGISGMLFPSPGQLSTPSRRQWLWNLAYAQWNLEEMREGAPWKHLTREE